MLAKQITTTFDGAHAHTQTFPLQVCPDTKQQELHLINLYPAVRYQKMQFFGGAITDAVAATLEKLPEEAAREVINAYFGAGGLGYRFIRTHIDSCDFATEPYAAVDDPADREFRSFSLERVERRVIRWIKSAYDAAGESLPVMLSPWSPPVFMKTNSSRVGGGKLKKECYADWARYICRYVAEFRARGINVTAISVQNEPNAAQTWDSCLFTPDEEREFLKDHLYPALCRAGLSDVNIYVWDHNKERMFDRACALITPETDSMISGAAFHWYSGDHFDAVRLVHEHFPDKNLMFSEGCIEYSRFDANQIKNARRYAHDMIGNLSAGMNQFVDWNICLDERGGPNYVGNYCEAPVICDTATGALSYKLSFHYIGHFSRYIMPGAERIATTVYTDKLEPVAFKNPDGSIAVVVLNKTQSEKTAALRLNGTLINTTLSPESISTLIIE